MQGFNYFPSLIRGPIIDKKDETPLGNAMRTLKLNHLLFQHIRSNMQGRFLVIARNHKCHRRFMPHPSIPIVLLHITRHIYSVCHTINAIAKTAPSKFQENACSSLFFTACFLS